MKRAEKIASLKGMLEQLGADQGGGLETLARGDGLESFDAQESPQSAAAKTGLQKLLDSRVDEVNDDELGGLEAIVMPQHRPVVFIKGGMFDAVGSPWQHLNEEPVRTLLQPAFASIGRIELVNTPWTYGGTGFVVGPDLIMTNRHVAKQFAEGVGERMLSFRSGEAALDFKREVTTPEDDRSAYFSVREVLMIHPYWDMALLRVDGLPAGHPALELATRAPESLVGRDVVVVGYPARDDRNDLDLQDRIFERTYNVKRLQPGKLRPRSRVRSFGNDVLALTHDSSTLGGNSGSAVVDVATGKVVALHFGGLYLKANFGVPAYELARDQRVIDAGVNFVKPPLGPPNEWDGAWQRADGGESESRAPVVRAPDIQQLPVLTQQSAAAVAASFTIPLQISISIGPVASVNAPLQTGIVQAPVLQPATEALRMQVPVIHKGLSARLGYRPGFLGGGVEVPLPTLTAAGEKAAARLEDGSPELKYHRFSIVLHKKRRMALFTAANVDWREQARLVDGHKPTRKELTGIPDKVAEQWVTDPRIPDEHQLPDDFYSRDGGAFDKGHLVRRDDATWGVSFNDIQKGNGDTYHTPNCSPQVAGFNQSSKGDDNWGDLENMIQKETKAERVIIFSGPVLSAEDPTFDGHDLRGEVSIQIPRSFWKIIVANSEAAPKAYGFLLEQELSGVPLIEELKVPAAWKRYMVSIESIEELLGGLASLDWLKQHDAIDTNEGVRVQRASQSPPRPAKPAALPNGNGGRHHPSY